MDRITTASDFIAALAALCERYDGPEIIIKVGGWQAGNDAYEAACALGRGDPGSTVYRNGDGSTYAIDHVVARVGAAEIEAQRSRDTVPGEESALESERAYRHRQSFESARVQ